jgi:class 3 adenylate cyclase
MRWRKLGYELTLGAGIAVGHATLGRIGFEGRYDYGALGVVTSLAARLSDEATGGQILLSQRAYAALEGRIEARPVARLELKGFARPVEAYELVGLLG